MLEARLQIVAQREILVQQLRVVAIGVPARPPGLVEPEPESVGVDFLTHDLLLVRFRCGRGLLLRGLRLAAVGGGRHWRHLDRLLAHRDGEVRRPLDDAKGAAHRSRTHALLRGALVGVARRDEEPIDVAAEALFLLGVGNGRLEHLRDVARHALLRVLQRGERVVHGPAANEGEDEARLLRRRPDVARRGYRLDHVPVPLRPS